MSSSSSRSYNRFIPKEELDSASVTQWSFGAVGENAAGAVLPEPPPPEVPPEPEPLPQEEAPPVPMVPEAGHFSIVQQTREQAYAEGQAAGHAAGVAQATQEWQQRMDDYVGGAGQEVAHQLAHLLQTMDESLNELQQRMARELLQLACDIARQVVRRELTNQPQALLPVVREALDMLVNEGRVATVRLHPHDLSAVENHLRGTYAQGRVQWQADPAVAPGDCLVESAGTVIDGSMEKRWRRAVAALGLVSSWQEGDDDGD